ncbi:hypothetical protein G7K_1452-t1 [Saitoella complicata NRRL Y-17804]|uniref:FHA domain-containing protein n=1 Tax=Saitoella complicata (strain BCRC 22490 / CBS 7301 / JCM 7358 / NBRC 10748 / NRRL Y-17804) TaxID=698492 RepID=A0A0E9NBI7_SAICN|nr:hypothetical protein G7K_1452-t1 [Saitoella complicata NRRL Y-17804]
MAKVLGTLLIPAHDDSNRISPFPVLKEEIKIGRNISCDVRIHDRDVSRTHCVIAFRDASAPSTPAKSNTAASGRRAWISNTGTHGTTLNGAALTKKTALEDGDVFEVLGNQFQWIYGAYPSTSTIDSPPIIDTPARPATASRGLFSGMGSLLRSAVKGRTPGRNVSPVKQTRFESPIKARSPITTTPHRASASPASGQDDVYAGWQSPLARKEEDVALLIGSPEPAKMEEVGELKTQEVGMYAEGARMLRDISNSPSPEGLVKVTPAPLFTKPASPSPPPPAPIAAPGTPLRANPPITIPTSIARARFAPPSPSPALLNLFSPAKPKRRVMEEMKEESPVRLPAMVPSVLRQGSPVVKRVEEEEQKSEEEEEVEIKEEMQEAVFDEPVTAAEMEVEVLVSATPRAAPQPAINTPVAGPSSKRAIPLSKKAFTPAPDKSRKWLDRDLPRAAPMSAPRPSAAQTANAFSAAAVLNNPSYSTAAGIERVEPHMHSHGVAAEGQRKVRVGVQEGKTPEEFLVGLSESERVLLGLDSTEAADGEDEVEEEQEQEKIEVFEDGESMRVDEEQPEEELVEEGLEELPAEPVEKRRLSGEQPGRILPAHLLPGSELTPVKTHSPGKWRATGPAKKMRLGAQSRPVGKLMRGTKRKFPTKYADEEEDAEGGERLGKRRRVMTEEEEEDEYEVVWRGVDGEEVVFYDEEFASETEEVEAEVEDQADEHEEVEVQADVYATDAVEVLEEAVDELAVDEAAEEQQQEEKEVDEVLEEQIEDGERVDAAQVKVDEFETTQPDKASVESAAQEIQLGNALPDGFATVADLPEINIGDLDTLMDDVPVAFAEAAAAAEAEVIEATAALADADAIAADLMQEFVNEVVTDALEDLAEEVAKETSEQEAAIVDMTAEVEKDETTEEQEIAELAKEVEGEVAPVPQTVEVSEVAAVEEQAAEQPVLERWATVEEFEDAVEPPVEPEAELFAEVEVVFEDASDVVVHESMLQDDAGAEAVFEDAIVSAQPEEAEVVEQADVSMADASIADFSAVFHDAVADVAAELAVVAENVVDKQASEETVEVAASETVQEEVATDEQVAEAALEESIAEDAPVLDEAPDAEMETVAEVAETQETVDSLPEIVVEGVATEMAASDDAEIGDAVPTPGEADAEVAAQEIAHEAADAEVSAEANVVEPVVQAEEIEAEAESTEQPEEVNSEESKAPLSPLKPIKTKRTRRTRTAESELEQEAPVEEPSAEEQEEPSAPLSPLKPIRTKRTRRGRTPEPEPESVVMSSPAPNFVVEISTPPPKTKRSTRSKAEEVVPSEPAIEAVEESEPAARRGRKAAATIKDAGSETTPDGEVAEEEEATPATRRSRRAATEEPAAEAPTAEAAAAQPTRGRKGRSRTITEPSEEPVQEGESVAAEEAPVGKATRTTRRARAAKDEVDEVNASETPEAVEEKPMVRRGRGAKAQAQEEEPAVVEEPAEGPTKFTRRARTNITYLEAPAVVIEKPEEKPMKPTRGSRRGKADDAVEVAVAVEVPASPPKPARRGRNAKENVPIGAEEPASEAAAPAKKTRGTRSRAATVEPEAAEEVAPAKGRGKRAASAAPSEAPAPKTRRTRGASAAPSELDSTDAPASSLADVDTNAKPARRGRAAKSFATEEPIPEEESVEEEPRKATRSSKRKAEVMEEDEPAPARRTTRRKV